MLVPAPCVAEGYCVSSEQAAQRITLRRDDGRLAAALAFARQAWKKRWVRQLAIDTPDTPDTPLTVVLAIPFMRRKKWKLMRQRFLRLGAIDDEGEN